MYVTPVRPPVNYGCWPWGSNYGCGYGSPVVCHGCCNHAYLPTHYAWGSPYSHVPQFHCPGSYSFPVPSPFYVMEQQPRYEYEKDVSRDHHCCGCPNHPSHQKEQKNVRIEEEESDRTMRKNESVVPFQFNNKPHPIVWLPPDNRMSTKDHGKPNNTEDNHENQKTAEHQPSFWNGWYPLDLNNLVSSKQMGDGERNQHQEDEGKGRLPFPLLWIPYKHEDKVSEEPKENNANAKPSVESDKGSGGEQKCNVNGDNIGGQAASRTKDIPVKEVERHEEKEKEKHASEKDGIGNGEQKLDNGEKKLPKDGVKRTSTSPPKSPKLPPVCLRVDPLPRRKTANGNSRSSSPPGNKEKVGQQSDGASKVLSSLDNKKPDKTTEFKAGKGSTRTIEVVDGKTHQGKSVDVKMENPVYVPDNSEDDVLKKQTDEKPKDEKMSQEYSGAGESVVKGQSKDAESAQGKNEECSGAEEVRADEAKESSRTKLSEEEAAVIIQSAYRGFEIRKWEPIKKLKQIAKVQEQITEVTHLIQAMEESSSDIPGNSKQRNIIAETIMSLLLKLDTIQGLHPSIREVRKSVVRELVGLQEKLDLLMNKKPEASQDSTTRHDEDNFKETDAVTPSQNVNEPPSAFSDPNQNQLDGGSNTEILEIVEANLTGEQPSEELQTEATPKGTKSALEPTIKMTDEKNNQVHENDETSIAKEDHEDLVLEQSSELPIVQNDFFKDMTEFAPNDHDNLESELAELPQGVLDDLSDPESKIHGDGVVSTDTSEDGQSTQLEEGSIELPVVTSELHNDHAEEERKEHVEIDNVSEFPQNVISDLFEPSEASDESEIPIAEAFDGTHKMSNMSNEVCGVSDASNSSPLENEMSSRLAQECTLEQERILVLESTNTHEAADIIGKEDHGEVCQGQNDGTVDTCSEKEVPSVQNQECDSEILLLPKESLGEQSFQDDEENSSELVQESSDSETTLIAKENVQGQSFKDVEQNAAQNRMDLRSDGTKDTCVSQIDTTLSQVSLASSDEVSESNKKLIEENERLREMIEKLIESGREQVTAISSLSGRVEDLEKRLSRKKKKLKVKRYRVPRSKSSWTTPLEGSGKQRGLLEWLCKS